MGSPEQTFSGCPKSMISVLIDSSFGSPVVTNIASKIIITLHSALKLEKSAISKVQKTLFAISKMAKNQFLHQKKV